MAGLQPPLHGLPKFNALQTATSNPARFLDRTDIGSVKPGELADLVLLYANPINDIQNTKKINAVIINGRYLDRAALDHMLAQAEAPPKHRSETL